MSAKSAAGRARGWPRRLAVTSLVLLALPAAAQGLPDTLAQRAKACTGCHRADDRQTPDGYVPRIAGKPAGYLLEQMRHFRDGRRQHQTMARLMEHLDDRYLAEIAGHFAALTPSHRSLAPQPLLPAAAQRAADWVRQGDGGAGIPPCVACHGAALTGVAPSVPGLLGLPAPYLAAQLGAWRTGLRHAREPDCMAEIARRLPAEDIALIARWLEAQPLPADPRPATTPPSVWPLRCGSVAR